MQSSILLSLKININVIELTKQVGGEKLIQTKFDLLLDYTEGNLYLNYVTAFSKASFKVGLQYNQQQLFDLKIEVEKGEVDLFHDELVKYLRILNKI